MKWPELVPDRVCVTPIIVSRTEGIGEDGAPKEVVVFSGKCSYSEKMKQVLDAERRLVTLSATALFNGDIAPGAETIEGYAKVNGGKTERMIFRSSRPRNPDGTVNFTQLELM